MQHLEGMEGTAEWVSREDFLALQSDLQEVDATAAEMDEELSMLHERLKDAQEETRFKSEQLTVKKRGENEKLREESRGRGRIPGAKKSEKRAVTGGKKLIDGGSKIEIVSLAMADDIRFIIDAFDSGLVGGDGSLGVEPDGSGERIVIHHGSEEAQFRMTSGTTFERLKTDACRYWDQNPRDAVIADQLGAVWPTEGVVSREIPRVTNLPHAWLVTKNMLIKRNVYTKGKKKKRLGEEQVLQDEKREHDEMRALRIMELLSMRQKAELNKKRLARRSVRWTECVFYLLFCSIALIIIFLRANFAEAYHANRIVRDTFVTEPISNGKTFDEIGTWSDIWMYMQDILVPNLYFGEDGATLYYKSVENYDGTQNWEFQNQNLAWGKMRLTQLRVVQELCEIQSIFDNVSSVSEPCFPNYADTSKTAETYGSGGTAFQFRTDGAMDVYGKRYHYKAAAGYTVNIDTPMTGGSLASASSAIGVLQASRWIDRATKVIVAKFAFYNPNLSLFVVCRLVWEIEPSGQVIPSSKFEAIPVHLFSGPRSWVVFSLEICQGLGLGYFFYKGVQNFNKAKRRRTLKRWLGFWTVLDLSILATYILLFCFEIYYHFMDDRYNFPSTDPTSDFVDFHDIGFMKKMVDQVSSFLIPMLCVRCLKFLTISPQYIVLVRSILKATGQLGHMFFLYCFVMFAFAMMGHVMFAQEAEDFASLEASLVSMAEMVSGNFDYTSFDDMNIVLSPMFFFFSTFIVSMVFANVFVAILYHYYMEASITRKQISRGEMVLEVNPDFVANTDDSLSETESDTEEDAPEPAYPPPPYDELDIDIDEDLEAYLTHGIPMS